MKRSGGFLVSLLLPAYVCCVAMAEESSNVRMLGEVHHFVQQSYDVAISGNYAYMASGLASGLRILDLSDPAAPVESGYAINTDRCPGVWNWAADRVTASGEYAYVLYYDGFWSSGHYRLYIYDVSDPCAPRQMGYISLPDNCTSLFVDGESVYITAFEMDGFSGVKVIDVSDPMQPVEVGSFGTPGMPQTVYVADSTAYVADNNALVIYDVTDPSSPQQLGSYAPESQEYLIIEVAVSGDHVLIADPYFGIRVLDASDFSQIREVGSHPHSQGEASYSPIRVSGDTAYCLRHGDGMNKELIILDLSDPTNPLEIGSHDMPGSWWSYGFDYCDGCACVAGGPHGLRVLDVSDPGSAREVGSYDTHGLTSGLAVSGDHAFISTDFDDGELVVYDVSDPSSPREVTALSVEGRPFWISTRGSYLHVPGAQVNQVTGVSVLDISDPEKPTQAAFWPCTGWDGVPLSVERYGDYAFVAMAYGGVQIYDVSQIDQPVALGNWTRWDPVTNQGFGVRNVKVSWPYLFVPDESYGLYVLDVSNPTTITEVWSYRTPGSAWWIDISSDGKYAYLSDFDEGLLVFDISEPSTPVKAGHYKENLEEITHLLVSGDTLYVAAGQGIGLHVLNVANPAAPVEVAYHKTPGANGLHIASANNLIYVVDLTHFEIFELVSEPSDVDETQPASQISDYRIESVYPNPFNPTATIVFSLAEAVHVVLEVYNVNGQKVETLVDGLYEAGRHTHLFQAENLASGTYILRLEAKGRAHSYGLTLVK